jgi:hypothetical protein
VRCLGRLGLFDHGGREGGVVSRGYAEVGYRLEHLTSRSSLLRVVRSCNLSCLLSHHFCEIAVQ